MSKPFGILSDSHHHGWSAFSTTLPNGVNSRLEGILQETMRCALEVKELGGDTIYHGGDLFHVRGSIAPSVLNPTMDLYRSIIKELGMNVVINAGNHDLESRDADRVSSAITALEGIGCKVINHPDYGIVDNDMVIIPWISNLEALKKAIEHTDPADRPSCDLLLHAPVDGVIPGLPDHGIDGPYLAGLGFRRVFSGHYHNHKEVVPGKVWSIGALTHQTWSDVNTKAGFLIVTDTAVKWRASRAPSFVEIDGTTDPDEIPLLVPGNYVRAKINSAKKSDVEALRAHLTKCGALGITIIEVKDTSIIPRTGGIAIKAGASLEQSVGDFITASTAAVDKAKLQAVCAEILTTVRSVKGAAE
jgi:DNA repair exonuclease SbcCD nuclease subunit